MDYRHKLTEVLQAVGFRVTPHSSQSMLAMAEREERHQTREQPQTSDNQIGEEQGDTPLFTTS